MPNVITLPVTSFTSHEKLARELNKIVSEQKVRGVFFNKTKITKGVYEIYLQEEAPVNIPQITVQHVDRPSKFKDNATSQYYCVYFDRFSGKWRYKFVRKNRVYNSRRFETELQAALAYDNHVYRVDGSTRKLNFPEKVFK